MVRYTVGRIAQAVLAVFAVILVTFILFKATPGDPTFNILGPRSTPEARATLTHELGLDKSAAVQFQHYSRRLVTGDFGDSNTSGASVQSLLIDRAGPTIALIIAGSLLSIALALCLAILTSTRRDGRLDHGIRLLSLVGLFLPTFWIGFVLIRVLAIPTGWFPVSGIGDGLSAYLNSLVLPAMTLSLGLTPIFVRSLRSSMIATLESEHVAAARALGLSSGRIMRRHVLRNSIAPTVSLLATVLGVLLFGVVVLETTFDIPGLGSALVTAAAQRDIPVLQGITVVFAISVVGINLLGDLCAALIDPRVRLS